jgi:hypothetical protein
VRWTDETTFLSRYADGWLVLAAGCTPMPASARGGGRYDCKVQGG